MASMLIDLGAFFGAVLCSALDLVSTEKIATSSTSRLEPAKPLLATSSQCRGNLAFWRQWHLTKISTITKNR